jgi:hypothetical protein
VIVARLFIIPAIAKLVSRLRDEPQDVLEELRELLARGHMTPEECGLLAVLDALGDDVELLEALGDIYKRAKRKAKEKSDG